MYVAVQGLSEGQLNDWRKTFPGRTFSPQLNIPENQMALVFGKPAGSPEEPLVLPKASYWGTVVVSCGAFLGLGYWLGRRRK